MLSTIFTYVLNMSIAASVVFIMVMLVRLILKNKLPKTISYILWSLLLVRLIIPFSFSTNLSVFNYLPTSEKIVEINEVVNSFEYIPTDIGMMQEPKIETGINNMNENINESLPSATPEASVNPMQVIIYVGSLIWICGVVGMLLLITSLFIMTSNKIKTAIIYKNDKLKNACYTKLNMPQKIDIFISEHLNTPIVFGLIKPRIILPQSILENKTELEHIILHELVHIKRKDHIFKLISLIVLSIHWFNPLVWAGFITAHKDMEMSCDERVIALFEEDIRRQYAYSLLNISIQQNNLLGGGFIAFGEKNINKRIKSIVNYKKPVFSLSAMSIILLLVLAVSLIGNPIKDEVDLSFLNHKNTLKVLELTVPLTINDGRDTLSPNPDFMKLFQQNKWKKKNISSPLELSSELEFNINEKLTLRLYDTEPLAMILYDGEYCYYKVPMEVYDDIQEYILNNKITSMNETAKKIEAYLEIIMSSPAHSSNPHDYIKEHQDEFESIVKMGDEALAYMLNLFETGDETGLKGHIMRYLCEDILGDRNNVPEGNYATGEEWYAKLILYDEVSLPKALLPQGNSLVDLATSAALKHYDKYDNQLTLAAPHVFGSYEKDGVLTIYATVFYKRFILYGQTLLQEGAGVVPCAMQFEKDSKGNYELKEYIEAMDGGYFEKSVREFCKPNDHIADAIMKHYGDYSDLHQLMQENLMNYLKSNQLTGISLKDHKGNLTPLT
ncbi:MAG: M56 family metallopeptidase [Clostridia bacterium]|nr:M56 family metallopeptidase [Clostridia bacterium]